MADLTERSRVTILITDDNPVNLKVVKAILDKNGYRTATAMDGAECIEATKKLKPNLILLDINMPEMSGIQVCKVLRQDQQTKDIPVIFVTANTDDETLKESFESGGTDYVRKPVNRIELLARIKSALDQKELMKKILEEEKLIGVLEMAGAICHELNHPMQAISGYSEMLMMDMAEGHALYEDLSEIKGQIERMGKITKKLMRITRYETRDYIGGRKIIDIDKASDAVK